MHPPVNAVRESAGVVDAFVFFLVGRCCCLLIAEERFVEAVEAFEFSRGAVREGVDATFPRVMVLAVVLLDDLQPRCEDGLALNVLGVGRIGAVKIVHVVLHAHAAAMICVVVRRRREGVCRARCVVMRVARCRQHGGTKMPPELCTTPRRECHAKVYSSKPLPLANNNTPM